MIIQDSFNKTARGKRQIILDTETTGLEGSRLVSVGMWEMVDGKLTGKTLYHVVNPEVTMSDFNVSIHHITNEVAAKEPTFAHYAKEIRDFIGDSQIVITCRTVKETSYTLDIAILNMELEKAGQSQIPAEQWLNVRRWSEEMFGNTAATLDAVCDHYKISREERIEDGHGALLDAQLLAAVYPKLLADYTIFCQPGPTSQTHGGPARNPDLQP